MAWTQLIHNRPTLLAATAAATLALAACGGSEDTSTATGSSPSVSSTSASPSGAEPTASSSAEAGPAEVEMVPVPTQEDGSPGLANITEFPVPAGAELDLETNGAPFNGGWQFIITSSTPEELAAFYTEVLPAMGYTVSEDATIAVGANEVEYAVGWAGPVYGTVDQGRLFGAPVVSVSDRTFDGFALDGTPVA